MLTQMKEVSCLMTKIFSILLLFLLTASVVAEEANLETESAEDERGFKITEDSKIDVSLALSPEYNSNVSRVSAKTEVRGQKSNEISDIIMHFTPGMRFKINDTAKVLNISLQMDYNYYTGYENKDTTDNYSSMNIKSRALGEFNKGSLWRVSFENKFLRSSVPQNQTINGLSTNLSENFELSSTWTTAEETLLVKLTGGFNMNYYEDKAFSPHNFNSYEGSIYGKWKFLPKTAVFLNSSYNYQDYYKAGATRAEQSSTPLNIHGGIIGQFTQKLSLKLSAGYVNTFSYSSKQDVTASVEGVWKFSENNLASIGFLRAYTPVSGYQYFKMNRIYGAYKHKLFSRILASLEGGYSFIDYGSYVGSDPDFTGKGRGDKILNINPSLSLNLTPWAGLKLNYTYENKSTPFYTDLTYTDPDTEAVTPIGRNYYDYTAHTIMFTALIDY